MNLALVVAGFLGATGVAAGAFGAHALEALVTPAQLDIWATAAQYHLIHAVVVMVLALSANHDRMSLGPWPVYRVHWWCDPVLFFSLCLCLNRNRDVRYGDAAGRNSADTELVVTDLSWGQVTAASDGGHLEATNRQRELKTMRRFTMVNCLQ